MYIKIYFDTKAVYLCDDIDQELNEIIHHPDAIFIDEINTKAINALLHEIVKEEFHAGVLWHKDLEALKKDFFKHFTYIEAAGGAVENADKGILFIKRLGKWDLPKGKIDPGESPEGCAAREIEEETGVTKLKLKHKICDSYHTYHAFGKHFIKRTYWFYLKSTTKQILVPQTEEHITALEWIDTKRLPEILKGAYPAIVDVVNTLRQSDKKKK